MLSSFVAADDGVAGLEKIWDTAGERADADARGDLSEAG